MSDTEHTTPEAAPTPADATPDTQREGSGLPEKASITLPLAAFVKDGTTTYASDMLVKEEEEKAERRRDVALAERRAAKQGMSADGSEMASMYTNRLSEHQDIPQIYIKLAILNRMGAATGESCCADLLIGADPASPMNLSLVIVCPRCHYERGLPSGQCQIQIHQSNRMFHFVPAPPDRSFEWTTFDERGNPVTEMLRDGGEIRDSERFTCPRCSWSAHIDRNRIWPD